MRMVAEIHAQRESEWAANGPGAELLGVKTPETVRQWVHAPRACPDHEPYWCVTQGAGMLVTVNGGLAPWQY
jgi:hypothetical protein